jgi:hypothetical protein
LGLLSPPYQGELEMADILKFPTKPEDPISLTLTGREWFCILLKLDNRAGTSELAVAAEAEAKMLQQLKGKG